VLDKTSTATIDHGTPMSKVDVSSAVKKETTKTTNKGTASYSYTAPKTPSNDKEVQALKDEITKYREEIKELTRVWSADEAAAYLGITNDKQKWLDEMNERTNDYYDAAVAEQQALRNDYVRNNANYIDMLTDAYIDSTKYVAPTATNRGIQAANLMNTSMSADTTNSSNDYGMQQNVQNFEAKRKAELENNPYLAEQEYNNIQTMLSNWSANKNTSDIKQYIDRLDAYTNYYAADRAYQAYLSQANAAKYSGLANVSQNKAQAIANAYGSNVNKYANMYELFKAGYGSDYAASNQLTHLWDQSSKANQK
jgi:DNA-binding transcriptional regulator GbsR (MarR family)